MHAHPAMLWRSAHRLVVTLAVLVAMVVLAVAPAREAAAFGVVPVALDDAGYFSDAREVFIPDPVAGDQLGYSVDIDGDVAVVGAVKRDSDSTECGSVFLYGFDGQDWVFEQEIWPSDGTNGDYFGLSVDVDDDTLVVGAPWKNAGQGAVYLYTRTNGVWGGQTKLTVADPVQRWGYAVALEGDTLVATAYGSDLVAENAGATYVFERTGDTWGPGVRLQPTGLMAGDWFGIDADLEGDTMVVGASGGGHATPGMAYVFVNTGSGWTQQAILEPDDGEDGDEFGTAVAVSGDTALVGAENGDGAIAGTGSAYVYVRESDSWTQQEEVYDPNGEGGAHFGTSVDIEGDVALIGAPEARLGGTTYGAAYVFTRSGGAWTLADTFRDPTRTTIERFGLSVVIDGTRAGIGAIGDRAGAVTAGSVALCSSYITGEDVPLVVPGPGVLHNDFDLDGSEFGAYIGVEPAHGELELGVDGSFTYTPDADWSGTDTFSYTAADLTGSSGPADVTLRVLSVNDPPVGAPDAYETGEDTALVIGAPGVLDNDSDVEGDPLTAAVATGPAHGTLALAADGSFEYTPSDGFSGADSFTYFANDGTSDSEAVAVDIEVVAGAGPPPALAGGVTRVAGADRYATAIEASKQAFPDGADAVVIATGANWPDALGGSALAGAVGGPLLLTPATSVPDAVLAEIDRLGAQNAYILGGIGAVGAAVEAQLKGALGPDDVIRLAGTDRYGTARAIADAVITLAGTDFAGDALVATGGNYPDALGGSPLAAAEKMPILLANPVTGDVYLPDAVDRVAVLGGTGAVSAQVEQTLKAHLGADNVVRQGGANRYETAAMVADYGVEHHGLAWDGVGVATGENFPDALSAGAMLGRFGTVMLLTPTASLHQAATQALSGNKDKISTAFVIGGTGAVSTQVEAEVKAALGL